MLRCLFELIENLAKQWIVDPKASVSVYLWGAKVVANAVETQTKNKRAPVITGETQFRRDQKPKAVGLQQKG